ncbi:MAG: filamentous hemagglutinin N-terminal domain-containing protein, partial [Deltaproteobacteria bacterium]|nr:filamentous hemagglutinin N-terminal domain-containing protein [Deltaproteobacteria bacterium]
DNVIGRIRDVNGSTIDGLIASDIPGANLYLINPYGIVFGENARLNVGGSFYAGTADYVKLGDGAGRFAATHIENTVLSVAAPTAFGFLGEVQPAVLSVLGSQLVVSTGETLGLIAGDLDIQGDAADTTLGAPSGRIDLVAVASAGEVRFGGDIAAPLLDADGFAVLGTIDLASSALVTTKGDPGGAVVIRSGVFRMASGARIDSSNTGDTNHPGLGLDADVRGAFEMNDASIAAANFGAGTAGSLRVRAGSVSLTGATTSISSVQDLIRGESFGTGDTGAIDIQVDGAVVLMDEALVLTETLDFGSGAGGDVNIVAARLEVRDGAQVGANARSDGPGGDIRVEAGEVLLENDAGSSHVTGLGAETEGSGDGGSIYLEADSVAVLDGAEIFTPTRGAGLGGSIVVNAGELRVAGPGAGIFATVRTFGSGDGGDVKLTVPQLVIDDSATIATFTAPFSDGGNAGDVVANSRVIRIANGGSITSSSFAGGTGGGEAGDAGQVIIRTDLLDVSSRGTISSDSRGPGSANLIDVVADTVRLTGGGVLTSNALSIGDAAEVRVDARQVYIEGAGSLAESDPQFSFSGISSGGISGAPGSIVVNAERLDVLGGGKIATQNFGQSETGGSITIHADHVTVAGAFGDGPASASAISSDSGQLLAFSPATGPAGDITIVDDGGSNSRLWLDDGGEISSGTRTTGKGGNIFIEFDQVKLTGGSTITVTSAGSLVGLGKPPGDAGDMQVIGRDRVRVIDSSIVAQADDADGGNIKLTSDGIVYLRNALISAASGAGAGSGGNVEIDPVFVVLDDSTISASAVGGDGGNITIVSDYFFATESSELNVTSELSNEGTIVIDSPDTDIVSEITALPESYLDAAELLRQRCETQHRDRLSGSFVVVGRDGVPPSPDGFLSAPIDDGEEHAASTRRGDTFLWHNPATEHVALVSRCRRS